MYYIVYIVKVFFYLIFKGAQSPALKGQFNEIKFKVTQLKVEFKVTKTAIYNSLQEILFQDIELFCGSQMS